MTVFQSPAPRAPMNIHVSSFPNLPASVRVIRAPTSTLRVGVAPWAHVRSLAALPAFSTPSVYALVGNQGRVGMTRDLGQRMRDHRRTPPMAHIDEVFAVTGDSFTLDTVANLEAALDNEARSAGVMPIVGAELAMPALHRDEHRDLRHWLNELPPLLLAAGCKLFEPDYATVPMPIASPDENQSSAIGSGAVRQGWDETFPADLLRRPATTHYVLERYDLRAEAAVHDCWTVLRAGSLITARTDTLDQRGVAQKRKNLRECGLLRPAGKVLRLLQDIAVPSLVNAARLVLGTNELATVWRSA